MPLLARPADEPSAGAPAAVASSAGKTAESKVQEAGSLGSAVHPEHQTSAAAEAADWAPADKAVEPEKADAAKATQQAPAETAAPARKTILSSLFGASLQPRSKATPSRCSLLVTRMLHYVSCCYRT